jgi:hypothetical protein
MSRIRLLLGFALSLLPALGAAESSTTRGPYTIHYSALPSTLITPEVARDSGLTRSASRGLLNIAVIKKDGDREFAVTAVIEAAATNHAGQRQSLRMREVRQGDAIYYLGEPRISDGERLDFELRISPEGADEPLLLRFAQSFHR